MVIGFWVMIVSVIIMLLFMLPIGAVSIIVTIWWNIISWHALVIIIVIYWRKLSDCIASVSLL